MKWLEMCVSVTFSLSTYFTVLLVGNSLQSVEDRGMLTLDMGQATGCSTVSRPTDDPTCQRLSLANCGSRDEPDTQTLYVVFKSPIRHGRGQCLYVDVCGGWCLYVDVCGGQCLYVDVCGGQCLYVDVCRGQCLYVDVCGGWCLYVDL